MPDRAAARGLAMTKRPQASYGVQGRRTPAAAARRAQAQGTTLETTRLQQRAALARQVRTAGPRLPSVRTQRPMPQVRRGAPAPSAPRTLFGGFFAGGGLPDWLGSRWPPTFDDGVDEAKRRTAPMDCHERECGTGLFGGDCGGCLIGQECLHGKCVPIPIYNERNTALDPNAFNLETNFSLPSTASHVVSQAISVAGELWFATCDELQTVVLEAQAQLSEIYQKNVAENCFLKLWENLPLQYWAALASCANVSMPSTREEAAAILCELAGGCTDCVSQTVCALDQLLEIFESGWEDSWTCPTTPPPFLSKMCSVYWDAQGVWQESVFSTSANLAVRQGLGVSSLNGSNDGQASQTEKLLWKMRMAAAMAGIRGCDWLKEMWLNEELQPWLKYDMEYCISGALCGFMPCVWGAKQLTDAFENPSSIDLGMLMAEMGCQ